MTEIKLYKAGSFEQATSALNELRDRAHAIAEAHGWWDLQEVDVLHEGVKKKALVQRTLPELLALVHSEVSEALEDVRAGRPLELLSYRYKSTPGAMVRELRIAEGVDCVEVMVGGEWRTMTPELAKDLGYDAKPVGIPSEMADIIIRVLDICGWYGIDIAEAVRVKMAYNDTRPYRHGGKAL